MIRPNPDMAADLQHVARELDEWPENTDFVYVEHGIIHKVQGGDASSVNYINKDQWIAAVSLHWAEYPEDMPGGDPRCEVCGQEHSQWEEYPGICAEYDAGRVPLEVARAIHNGDGDKVRVIA